jgi:hypothetical protein
MKEMQMDLGDFESVTIAIIFFILIGFLIIGGFVDILSRYIYLH